MTAALAERARGVRLLTCDVDGVLTDGRIYMGDDGRERIIKIVRNPARQGAQGFHFLRLAELFF